MKDSQKNFAMSTATPAPISDAQQKVIFAIAPKAVASCAKSYASKHGLGRFFTKEELEDITGEVYYKACRSFGTFNPSKSALPTWVWTIAFRCVLNAVDYKVKRLPISCEMYEENDHNGDEYSAEEYCDVRKGFNSDITAKFSEYEADRELFERDFREQLQKEVSKLSEKNQRYVSMLEDGLTRVEMAEVEGCSADAAAKRVWVIRQTLGEPVAEIAAECGISCTRLAS